MNGYWDARAEAERILVREPQWAGRESFLAGAWHERNWLNVPGPFYGALTDTCCAGLDAAPQNVLTDAFGMEFVWRQPRNPDEVTAVLEAAWQEPFGAYNWDGDEYWTPEAVIGWWDTRDRVKEWAARSLDLPGNREIRGRLDEYVAYFDGDLERDLELYAKWLGARSA